MEARERAGPDAEASAPDAEAETLPLRQWLWREAVRRTAAAVAGPEPSHFRRHLETQLWGFLRQAVRVPRDFKTLSEALDSAPSWPPTTVLVDGGCYEESLVVNKPVTIIGAAGAALSAKDANCPVTFSCECKDAAPQLRNFRLSSERAPCLHAAGGAAVVKGCTVSSGHTAALDVTFSACPRLLDNEFTANKSNKGAAVMFGDQAGGLMRGNRVCDNAGLGVVLRGSAAPTVERNVFSGNKGVAVFVKGQASGIVRENEFDGNEGVGIHLANEARPEVEGNTLRGHTMPAIMVKDEAAGTIRRNLVEANLGLGITICNSAAPTVEENELVDNKKKAQGREKKLLKQDAQSLRNAGKSEQEIEAILDKKLQDRMRTQMVRMEVAEPGIKGAKRAAIVAQDGSAPVVRGNKLRGNDGYGILVSHTSTALVENNELSGHWRPAIAVRDESRCTVRNNHLFGNEGIGIVVLGSARPSVEGNRMEGLRQPGIWLGGSAAGSVRGNRCSGAGPCIIVCDSASTLVEDNFLEVAAAADGAEGADGDGAEPGSRRRRCAIELGTTTPATVRGNRVSAFLGPGAAKVQQATIESPRKRVRTHEREEELRGLA